MSASNIKTSSERSRVLRVLRITFDQYDYRVPGPDGREATAYYTDDYQDAIESAHAMFGERIDSICVVNVDEHPTTSD